MAKKNYEELSNNILPLIGGKENITFATHCMTRLRLTLKDKSLVREEEIKNTAGVIGTQWMGDQIQIIIGQDVGELYKKFCEVSGLAKQPVVEENLDAPKQKLTLKGIGNSIVTAVVSCTVPILPALVGGGMLKVIYMLFQQFAPELAATSTLRLINALGTAAIYFFPVLAGVAAASYFKTSMPLAVVLCAFLVYSNFLTGYADGTMTTIFTLPIYKPNYGNTMLPAILTVWVLSYVERFFKKIIPNAVQIVLVSTCSLLVMLPLTLVVLAPLGDIIGVYMSQFLMFLYNTFGFIGMGIMGALRPLLIFTGMHHALAPIARQMITETGFDPFYFGTGITYVLGIGAASLAVFLRAKKQDNKATALACASSAIVGGITEPGLYGILFRFKRPLFAVMAGNFLAGAYMGLTNCYVWAMPGSTGIFGIPVLIGPEASNLINGLIAIALSMITAFTLTYIMGIKED